MLIGVEHDVFAVRKVVEKFGSLKRSIQQGCIKLLKNVTVHFFIMLQNISISNKCCF